MKSTYLYKYLNNIYTSFDVFPFYKERLNFALLQIEDEVTFERTVSSPHSLNDLGVRKDNNPLEVFRSLKEYFKFPTLNVTHLDQDIKSLTGNQLGIYLDSYFLTIGDYELIENSVLRKVDEIDDLTSFESSIFIASFLASIKNNKCIEFFKNIIKFSANQIDKITARHRLCAYYIKRVNDKDVITNELKTLKDSILELNDAHQKAIYLSLYNNLYALYLLKLSVDSEIIETLLNDATLLIDLTAKSNIDKKSINQSIRYRSQILINKAQLYVFKKKYDEAIVIMSENIDIVSKHAPEYLAECFSTTSYIYYLLESYDKAIEYGKKGIELYLKNGSLTKSKTVKDILISSLL